jgi:predicted oxidoreductase
MEFSSFIIGCMRLGSWGADLGPSALRTFIERCLELGLRDFDHADIYGDYTTESQFGDVLRQAPGLRRQLRLTTKCGIKLLSPNRPAHKLKSYDSGKAHILTSVDQSLRNFNTDYIDLLLLHRPDLLMQPDEVAEAFTELKASGKVLHFGVSNYSPSQFDLLHSSFPLVTNQIEASLLHLAPFFDGTLDQCLKYGIRPTAWSPLGGGQLFLESRDEKILRIQQVGQQIAHEYELSLDQLLLAWLMQHPARIVPVLGTSRVKRVEKALQATSIALSREHWYELLEAARGKEVD